MEKFIVATVLFYLVTLHGLNATNSTRLKCHECTSLNNTRCGDPFEAVETLRECQPWGDLEATLCRKLRQMVDTPIGKQIRVTRTCGYIENSVVERDENCFKASFSAATSSRYCTCKTEGCNAGETLVKSPSLLIFVTVIYALFSFY